MDVVGDEVLAVRRGVEDQRADLLLRVALLRDEDGDLADIRRGRGLDGGYLPDAVGVVSPGDVQEGFDGFTGGSSGGEVFGIDGRELRLGRSSGGGRHLGLGAGLLREGWNAGGSGGEREDGEGSLNDRTKLHQFPFKLFVYT